MGRKENKVEEKLRLGVEAMGGKLYKMRSLSTDGWPDRLSIVPHRRPSVPPHMALIEAKTPEGSLLPSQVVLHRELAAMGVTVLVISSEEFAEDYLTFVKGSGYGLTKVVEPPPGIIVPGRT